MSKIDSQIEQLVIERNEENDPASQLKFWFGLIVIILIAIIIILMSRQTSGGTTAVTNEKTASDISSLANKPKTESKTSQVTTSKTIASKTAASKNNNNLQQRVLDASGHIVARRIATVSSRVTGKITKLNIEEGQQVLYDDILAELDDRQAKISYLLALADLAAIKASYQELNILYQHELKLFKRRKDLANKNLISDEAVESSEMKTRQMAAQLKNRSALVKLSEQSIALAQYQLDQHKIRAPFDGVVISKNAQVGELISAGSSGGGFIRTGVGTIVDMSSLEIEVEVGESYINRVYSGQQVEARLDAYPSWNIKSEVIAIIPTADRQKATIKVRIKLLETSPRILPDMGIKVSFLATAEN